VERQHLGRPIIDEPDPNADTNTKTRDSDSNAKTGNTDSNSETCNSDPNAHAYSGNQRESHRRFIGNLHR
jgi:hypothetical protein